jgi:hypothetical protein
MPSLGFTIGTNFERQPAPRRRGVGRQIDDVDQLVTRKERRSHVRTTLVLAALGAAGLAVMTFSDSATVLLRQLAGLP